MAIEVAKVELKNVQDASGMEAVHPQRPIQGRRGHRRHRQDRGQWRRQRFYPHPRRSGVSRGAAQARQPLRTGDRANPDGVVGRLRRRHHAACDGVRAQRQDRPGDEIAARHRHGDERRDSARRYRPAGHGREGRRGRARGDARRRHRRSGRRALRADQDAAARPSTRCSMRRRAARMSPARCTIPWACRTAPLASALPSA